VENHVKVLNAELVMEKIKDQIQYVAVSKEEKIKFNLFN